MSDHWAAELPEEIRNNPTIQDTPDVETAAKRLIETKAMVGSSLRPPGEGASDEDWNAFDGKLKDLGYVKADTAPEKPVEVEVDGEALQGFLKGQAKRYHDMGLGKRTTEKLLKSDEQAFKDATGGLNDQSSWAEQQLAAAWEGNVKENIALALKAAAAIEAPEGAVPFADIMDAELSLPDGRRVALSNYPRLIMKLSEMGGNLGEDNSTGPDGGGGGGESIETLRKAVEAAMNKWSSIPDSDPAKKIANDELVAAENALTRAQFGVDFDKLSEQEIMEQIGR